MQVEAKADKPAMVKNVKVKIVGNKASVKYKKDTAAVTDLLRSDRRQIQIAEWTWQLPCL